MSLAKLPPAGPMWLADDTVTGLVSAPPKFSSITLPDLGSWVYTPVVVNQPCSSLAKPTDNPDPNGVLVPTSSGTSVTWQGQTRTSPPEGPAPSPTTNATPMGGGATRFLPVRPLGVAQLSPGFTTSGGECGWPASGQTVTPANEADYVYVKAGGIIMFDFSVPSGGHAGIAWILPAGSELDQGTAQLSVDDGAPITVGQNAIAGYYSTTSTALTLWSKSFGPGHHSIKWVAPGPDVHVYGVETTGTVTPNAAVTAFCS